MKALGLAESGAAVRPPQLARGTSAAAGAAGTCTAGGLIGREPDVVAICMVCGRFALVAVMGGWALRPNLGSARRTGQ